MNISGVGRGLTAKALVGIILLAVSGCANAPQNASNNYTSVDSDPMESVNRAIFQFNETIDGVFLKPVTQIYRGITPKKGQEMVSNFLENLYEPVTFFNSILQGDPENSFESLWSFIINSTVGVGGLFDAATEIDLAPRKTDFGQTLAMYGVDRGTYVVLPIIGPSSVRGSFGRLGDALMNPFSYIDEPTPYIIWGATAVNARSENMKLIDDIYRTSLDPYTTFRSGYTQKRKSEIRRAIRARNKSQKKAGF